MNRAVVAGVAASMLVIGASTMVAKLPTTSSLPDVQVPAIELSNAGDGDATAAWLGVFMQAAGSNADSLSTGLLESGQLGLPDNISLVVIEPGPSAQDFDDIFGVVDKMGNPMDAVRHLLPGSPGNGS